MAVSYLTMDKDLACMTRTRTHHLHGIQYRTLAVNHTAHASRAIVSLLNIFPQLILSLLGYYLARPK